MYTKFNDLQQMVPILTILSDTEYDLKQLNQMMSPTVPTLAVMKRMLDIFYRLDSNLKPLNQQVPPNRTALNTMKDKYLEFDKMGPILKSLGDKLVNLGKRGGKRSTRRH